MAIKLSDILCKLGIHRPLNIKHCQFIDTVTHKEVFEAYCPCGKRFLTDSVWGWFGSKVESKEIKFK